jgi:hypothetical protein
MRKRTNAVPFFSSIGICILTGFLQKKAAFGGLGGPGISRAKKSRLSAVSVLLDHFPGEKKPPFGGFGYCSIAVAREDPPWDYFAMVAIYPPPP